MKIATGFFDDDFFLYREDVDLAWRLRGRGWTARCVPAARAWHRRRNLPERRREMSAAANLHSVKNRFLLRINNAGKEHLAATFARTFVRDLVVVGRVPHGGAQLAAGPPLARGEPHAPSREARRDPRRAHRDRPRAPAAGSRRRAGGRRGRA